MQLIRLEVPMPVLRVTTGAQKGKIHPLESESFVLGRESTGNIQVLDQGVSRRHAEVLRIGEMYFIRDLESRNGTFLNDQPVEKEILRVGDQIRIGNTSLVFEDKAQALRQSTRVKLERALEEESPLPTATIQLKLDPLLIGRPSAEPEAAGETASRDVNLLFHLGQIMSEEKNLSRLLERMSQSVGEVLKVDNLYVLWKQHDESFDLLGRYDGHQGNGNLPGLSRGVIRDCIRHGRAILTADASMDGQFDGMASVVMNQLRSIMCVPIQVLGKNLGVLYLYSQRAEAFSSEDLELASTVGIQLGTTIGLLKSLQNSDRFFRTSVRTLVSAMEMRDPTTQGQSERVATYCLAISKELGLDRHEHRMAWLSGMLHDLGSAPMSDEERSHAVTLETRKNSNARKLLKQLPDLEEILPALENQNERFDGSGSPAGRSGDAIPLGGRILGLALAVDELLSDEDGISLKETLLKLKDEAGRKFDRETINALLIAYRNGKLFNADEEFFEVPLD